jgi:ribosome-associated translation inhibitor RaiA
MVIQFDIAHSINANDTFRAPFIEMLKERLDRFDKNISRLEVHLSDENGHKNGVNDKRCLLEAHIAGVPHIVATNHGNSYEQAVDGAIDKLIASLHSIHGRLEHSHKASKQEEATDMES